MAISRVNSATGTSIGAVVGGVDQAVVAGVLDRLRAVEEHAAVGGVAGWWPTTPSPVSRAACTLSMASRAFSRAISIGVDAVMRCTPSVNSPTSGSSPPVRMSMAASTSMNE